MNLSELILNGRILNVKVAEDIHKFPNLEIITEQDGDIPGLFGFYIDDLYFEIIVINSVIIGIQYDFTYEIKKPNVFRVGEKEIVIDEKTSMKTFTSYLENVDLSFEIVESKFESKKVVLEKSNTSFYFDKQNDMLFKLSNFDNKLYDNLANHR